MKQLTGLLIGLGLVLTLVHCRSRRPTYNLDVLQGTWRRIASNNPDADSMLLLIRGNQGQILYTPPNSNFIVNEIKWFNITSVVSPRDFTLSDESADSTRWQAAIFVESFDGDRIMEFRLESIIHKAAPGGQQTWVRE